MNVEGANPNCSDLSGTPYCAIQAAIEALTSTNTIRVKDGKIYDEVLIINTANITIEAAVGHAPVIVSAGSVGCIISINAPDVTLDGFNLSAAQSVGTDNDYGLCVNSARATIKNNTLHHVQHYTTQRGGTLILGSAKATGLQILSNTLYAANNAIKFDKHSSPPIKDVVIRGNTIWDVYEGFYGNYSSLSNITIAQNTFSGYNNLNRGLPEGGSAISLYAGDAPYYNSGRIENNLIYGWQGLPYTILLGGRNAITPSRISVINNSLIDNDVNGDGQETRGAISIKGCRYNAAIKNNIIAYNADVGLYGNEDGFGQTCGVSPYNYLSAFELDYNNVYSNSSANYRGLISGSHALSLEPAFISYISHDYHLSPTSRLIDSGVITDAPTVDIEGALRPLDGNLDALDKVDMGAYEYAPLRADLLLRQTRIGAGPILSADRITYTIIFTNAGPDTIYNVVATNTLTYTAADLAHTNNFTISTITSTQGLCEGKNAGPVVCHFNNFTHTAVMTLALDTALSFSGAISSAAVITPVGYIVETAPANNLHPLAFPVRYPVADLQVSQIRAGQNPILAGERITYTISFSNAGPDTLYNVVATDTLSHTGGALSGANSFTISTVASSRGLCEGKNAGPVICRFNDFTNTAVMTLLVETSLSFSGTLNNSLLITPDGYLVETAPANNLHSLATPVRYPTADLQISKIRRGSGVVTAGNTITYTITITNAGPDTVDLIISDTFSSGRVNAGDSPPECSGTGPLLCKFNHFTATKSFDILLTSAKFSGTLTNSASITFSRRIIGVDATPQNNKSRPVTLSLTLSQTTSSKKYSVYLPLIFKILVSHRPDLTIDKSDGGLKARPGNVISYQLSYTNIGKEIGSGVMITETVPANTRFNEDSSTPGWSCGDKAKEGSVCVLSVGDLAPQAGGLAIFAVTVDDAVAVGVETIVNRVSISDDGQRGADPSPGNNFSKTSTPVAARADLIVSSLTASGHSAQAIIKNQGEGPVMAGEEFWVDFYVNPSPPPTGVNEVWYDGRSKYGLVWLVTAPALPINPGETVTLTYSSEPGAPNLYFSPDYSNFPDELPAGTPVWLQVDSANVNNEFGGVLENHEQAGEAYNNIYGPVPSAAAAYNQGPRPESFSAGQNWRIRPLNPPLRPKQTKIDKKARPDSF